MSVHYKFKSTLDFDTITFDGLYISVGDLKKEILQQKRLGKLTDFDLQVTNAQTKEEYNEESCLIPKNTSLIIARIPLTQPKKAWNIEAEKTTQNRATSRADGGSLDLSKMEGSEEDKINAMMMQSTADYDPKSYQRLKGHSQTGEVPPTYRCNRCKRTGHWIKNCTFNGNKEHIEVKRNTGIPRSFLEKSSEEKLKNEITPPPAEMKKEEIPEDLICVICNDLFTDAVMIPCCGSSFCDDCVRTALLESEENECPDCKEKNCSPESLIPNRFLRNSVNVFKNETGYKAAPVKKVVKKVEPQPKAASPEQITEPIKTITNEKEIDEKATINKEKETVEEKADANLKDKEKVTEKSASAAPATTLGTESKTKSNSLATPLPPKLPILKAVPADLAVSESKATESPNFEETESDYEDNITVTVPIAQTEAQRAAFRERPFNDPNSRALKPPGIDSSPRNHVAQPPPYHGHGHGREGERRSPLLSHPQFHHWEERGNEHHEREHERGERNREPKGGMYEKGGIYNNNNNNHMGMPPGPGQQPHMPFCPPYGMEMSDHNMRGPMGSYDMFPDPGHRMGMYGGPMGPQHQPIGVGPPPQQQMHGMGSFNNMYNPIPPRPTMGFNRFPPMMRPAFPNARLGFMPMRMPRHMMPPNNLASVYQGVAAKVGTGIIDDPLEAFNRIMKEKEKRKEERRRSPDRRRSRSNERQMRTRFRSPLYDRGNARGNRDVSRGEKRGRSRERDVRRDRFRDRSDHEWEKGSYRHRRSNSFSDRGSRSRSRSNSLPKMSRSPNHQHRRSRSRPRSFVDKPRQDERDRSNGRSEPKHPDMQPRFNSRERSMSRLQDDWELQGLQNPNDFRDNSKPRDEISFNQPLTPTRKRESSVENRSKMMDEPPPPGFEGLAPSNMPDWDMPNERPYPHSPPYVMQSQPAMGPNDREMHRERERERDRERDREREKQWEREQQNKERVKEVPVRERERERERVKERDVEKDRHRGERDKEREREKDKNRDKEDKEKVREKIRDTDREKEKQRERERNKERTRDRDREKEREAEREREKHKEREKNREREKEKEKERERTRDKDRERIKDMERERERERDREREKEKERDIEREKEREREKELRDKHIERGREREREREREKPRRSVSHDKNILASKTQDRDRYTHRSYDREGREIDNSKDRHHEHNSINKNKTNEHEATSKGQIRKINPFAARESEVERPPLSDDEKHSKDRKKRKKDKNERRKSRKLKKEKRSRSKHKDNPKDNAGSGHENDKEHGEERKEEEKEEKQLSSPIIKAPEERNSLNNLKNSDLNLKITFSVNKREEDALNKSDADEERHVSTAGNIPLTLSTATTITTTTTATTTIEHTQIPEQINDLYADICEEGELLDEEKKITVLVRDDEVDQTPIDLNQSKTLKHFDSVLDIHDYEMDFDELQNPLKSKMVSVLPEISKWEREDQQTTINNGSGSGSIVENKFKGNENSKEKVTNEIIRKAENAIFTRAINAIRPTENHSNMEKSTQRRGTSADKRATTPPTTTSTIMNKNDSAKDLIRSAAIKTFQITVPASTQERSVEIRGAGGDKKKSNSPRQVRGSVKERLGRKIVNKSFSPTTTRDFQSRSKRSHSLERGSLEGRNDKKRRVEEVASNRSSGGVGRGFRSNNNNTGTNRRYNNDGNNNNNKNTKSSEYSLERNINKDKREREREQDYSVERYKSQQKKSVTEHLEINSDKEKYREHIRARNNRETRSKSTEIDNIDGDGGGDDDEDDDATDTDDSKRKRNKRTKRDKKDKKRAKRSSSEESNDNDNNDNDDDSGGDKRGKHLKVKKRNKSERKKKKNKK